MQFASTDVRIWALEVSALLEPPGLPPAGAPVLPVPVLPVPVLPVPVLPKPPPRDEPAAPVLPDTST